MVVLWGETFFVYLLLGTEEISEGLGNALGKGFAGAYCYFYNGKELIEDNGLEYYDYGARMYSLSRPSGIRLLGDGGL